MRSSDRIFPRVLIRLALLAGLVGTGLWSIRLALGGFRSGDLSAASAAALVAVLTTATVAAFAPTWLKSGDPGDGTTEGGEAPGNGSSEGGDHPR